MMSNEYIGFKARSRIAIVSVYVSIGILYFDLLVKRIAYKILGMSSYSRLLASHGHELCQAVGKLTG